MLLGLPLQLQDAVTASGFSGIRKLQKLEIFGQKLRHQSFDGIDRRTSPGRASERI